ncbi:hypothetical protein H6P81_017370 [Aristolochia fimbriata]|uniref:Uncharacterized protein n=1 Tax=Aristolochia fimbriata TaxID=158543 RepID=A0AAV7DZC2_ARIFI|nr:hypothetical protein H6P81_017370 [Aristolochia fimbriata]
MATSKDCRVMRLVGNQSPQTVTQETSNLDCISVVVALTSRDVETDKSPQWFVSCCRTPGKPHRQQDFLYPFILNDCNKKGKKKNAHEIVDSDTTDSKSTGTNADKLSS